MVAYGHIGTLHRGRPEVSEYIDVLSVDEIRDGGMTKVSVAGDTLLIARVGEQYYAARARCPHMGGDLSKGSLEGTVVRCPLHGSQFDLSDGSVRVWVEPTGIGKLLGKVGQHHSLEVFEVDVRDGRVLVGPQKPLAPVEQS